MNNVLKGIACRVLALAVLLLPFHASQAGMIGVDPAVDNGHLQRTQIADELQAAGVDAEAALERVAAMTDAEVSVLAGQVDAAPAGGLIELLLLVFLVWFVAFR
jgi:hypothetical protein